MPAMPARGTETLPQGRAMLQRQVRDSSGAIIRPARTGRRAPAFSEFAIRLREKQKVKRIYGLMEGQFSAYFEMAERMDGITGENLLVLLERRLDNVVYRLGFASSLAQARQVVRHGHLHLKRQESHDSLDPGRGWRRNQRGRGEPHQEGDRRGNRDGAAPRRPAWWRWNANSSAARSGRCRSAPNSRCRSARS